MRRIYVIVFALICTFGFIGIVNAEEVDLNSVATISTTVGGSDEEIIQVDSSSTYTYYYKYVKIDDSDFNTYINSKYIAENGDDSTDEYATATSQVSEYETTFYGLIPTVSGASDVSSWTKSTDNQIVLKDLTYQQNKHNGYVLAVAAVKEGDSNVYITRIILESKSTTTLGEITFNDNDENAYNEDMSDSSNTENTNIGDDTTTSSNPNTGLNDYAIYLVPLSLVLGSGILLRKTFANN